MALASVLGSIVGALLGTAWGLDSSVDELSNSNRNESVLGGVIIGMIFLFPASLLIRPLRSWLGIVVVGLSALTITSGIVFIMVLRIAVA